MPRLEHKIPPPILMLLCTVLMWLTSKLDELVTIPSSSKIVLIFILVVCAMIFIFGGIACFKKSNTTINPLQPETASKLVITGIYQISRNPMYVGLSILLFAWSIYLTSIFAFAWVGIFMMTIQYLQIIPEERALTKLFGDDYKSYQAKVRRWL